MFSIGPQLAVHLLDVPLNRIEGQGQFCGNFGAGEALCLEQQDFAFPARQGFNP
jgi:hypothetical protein